MLIRVLGCSGSIAAGSRTSSFLVDDDVLLDAGTGVGDLPLQDLARIDHVFLTHSHLDHVVSVGLLADSVTRLRRAAGRPPIQVHALPETVAALRTHVFNGVIWPDFTRLPSHDAPMLRFAEIHVGDVITLGARRLEVLPACHTVPAVGYAVTHTDPPEGADAGAWVFTGDTGPNPALWQRLVQMRVATLVIETAFGNDEQAVAEISQHLCPRTLAHELAQLQAPAQVFITHIKPGEVDAVMTEIAAQGDHHRIAALVTGQVMALA